MVAPTLNNYEYQYKDAGVGVLLNGQAATPFWDVEKVTGLVDFPEFASQAYDVDGRHGSAFSAKFTRHRTIIFEGTLYDSVSNLDTTVDTFKGSIIPDDVDYPLYWKHPVLAQRYYLAKPSVFQADVEAGRRVGLTPFQIQWVAQDPRAFIDLATVNWTSGVDTSGFINAGKVDGPLVVNITANATTTASITIANTFQFRTVTIAGFSVTSGQAVTIDCDNWIVRVAGAVKPATMVPGGTGYPSFYPGNNIWRVTSNIGNGTITAKSAWL